VRCPFEGGSIIDIVVGRRNIKVSRNQQRSTLNLITQARSERLEPLKLVAVVRVPESTAIWDVDREYPDSIDICRDTTCLLRVVDHSEDKVVERLPSRDSDPVPTRNPPMGNMVTVLFEELFGKVGIFNLGLLKTEYVRLVFIEPESN
jgi:hypothetical protein